MEPQTNDYEAALQSAMAMSKLSIRSTEDDDFLAACENSLRESRPELDFHDEPEVHAVDAPTDVFGDNTVVTASVENFKAHTRYAFTLALRDNRASLGRFSITLKNAGTNQVPDYVSTITVRNLDGRGDRRFELHDAGAITQQFVTRTGEETLPGVHSSVLLNYNMCFFLSVIIAARKVWCGHRNIQQREIRKDWNDIDKEAVDLKMLMRGANSVKPEGMFGAHVNDVYIASDNRPMSCAELSHIYEAEEKNKNRRPGQPEIMKPIFDVMVVRRVGDDCTITAWVLNDDYGRQRAIDLDRVLFMCCYMHSGGEHFMPYTQA